MADVMVSLTHVHGSHGEVVSYLCVEDHHGRCTGLVSPTGYTAYLCGCRDRDCSCNDRARTKHADLPYRPARQGRGRL